MPVLARLFILFAESITFKERTSKLSRERKDIVEWIRANKNKAAKVSLEMPVRRAVIDKSDFFYSANSII